MDWLEKRLNKRLKKGGPLVGERFDREGKWMKS